MVSQDYIEAQNQEKNKVTSCFQVISPKALKHTETTQWTCTSNKLIDFCIRHDPSNVIRHNTISHLEFMSYIKLRLR